LPEVCSARTDRRTRPTWLLLIPAGSFCPFSLCRVRLLLSAGSHLPLQSLPVPSCNRNGREGRTRWSWWALRREFPIGRQNRASVHELSPGKVRLGAQG